jgi:hypothetical protein
MSATPREVVERVLQVIVGPDRERMADLYADDVEIEMPFLSPGTPPLSGGREGLRARLAGAAKVMDLEKVDNVHIHGTDDPEVVVAEYRVHGRFIATGRPLTSTFIMVTRVRDGLIVHSRDYANPLAGREADPS